MWTVRCKCQELLKTAWGNIQAVLVSHQLVNRDRSLRTTLGPGDIRAPSLSLITVLKESQKRLSPCDREKAICRLMSASSVLVVCGSCVLPAPAYAVFQGRLSNVSATYPSGGDIIRGVMNT